MEDDVRKQTFPLIGASPGWFFGLFSVFASIILGAALHFKLVHLSLEQILPLVMEILPQLFRLQQALRPHGLWQAFRRGRTRWDPEVGASRAVFQMGASALRDTQSLGFPIPPRQARLRRRGARSSSNPY